MKYIVLFIVLFSNAAIADITCSQANAQFSTGDKKKAVDMFLELAKSGESCGYEGLGEAYLQGWGIEKNLKKSLIAWKKAEEIDGSELSSIKVAYLERVLNK